MINKGQVWIETVIYTVIGITLIALVLAFVTPKVTQTRERIAVEQAIETLQAIDEKVSAVITNGPGNIRALDLTVREGSLIIDSMNDSIRITLPRLRTPYSEPNTTISIGPVYVSSFKNQRAYGVDLFLLYSANITYQGANSFTPIVFTAASTPYRLSIENINNTFINIGVL